jgi:LmbE family N-acetylglucosaminyl deacetylase
VPSEEEEANSAALAQVYGSTAALGRRPRIVGVFAHPDDEVFCVGGTIARCAAAGADTSIVSLTRGEGGQICDAEAATRRTLGAVRENELALAGHALGVDRVACLDLGDGRLADRALADVTATVRSILDDLEPDVVVSFGPDGATGHPDHVVSCLATMDAVQAMAHPPRLLHARFPKRQQLLLDLIVEWLTSTSQRFTGTTSFGQALKLFADGSSMLGFAADHFSVEWFPAGSFVIEQGEPAQRLFCILSGVVDIVVEDEHGGMRLKDTSVAGSFVGEDGLASGRPRNAHVIAREDVTCLVLAPHRPTRVEPRGAGAAPMHVPRPRARELLTARSGRCFTIDVTGVIGQKVDALAAHRSQYALRRGLFPTAVLERLLGEEHFIVADVAGAAS